MQKFMRSQAITIHIEIEMLKTVDQNAALLKLSWYCIICRCIFEKFLSIYQVNMDFLSGLTDEGKSYPPCRKEIT